MQVHTRSGWSVPHDHFANVLARQEDSRGLRPGARGPSVLGTADSVGWEGTHMLRSLPLEWLLVQRIGIIRRGREQLACTRHTMK